MTHGTWIKRFCLLGNRPGSERFVPYFLAVCVVMAAAVRFLAHCCEPTINCDGIIYIDLAEQWLRTGTFPESFYLPLYPWLMKLLMSCGLSGHAAGLTVNIICGSLLPLVVYAVMRLVFIHRETAVLAALVTVFHPPAVELSISLFRDIPYLLFCGCAIWAGLSAVKTQKCGYWILCGMFCAAGLFFRYEALELVPVVFIYFAVSAIAGKSSWKKTVCLFSAYLVSLVVICGSLLLLMGVGQQMKNAYMGRIERLWNSKR